MAFRFLTAGESHGKALVTIVEGLPAGFKLDSNFINQELTQRQQGFGRSGRMKIEKDRIEILSGIKNGKTLGSPITFLIKNKDSKDFSKLPALFVPRPGHADLVGTLKFQHDDIRNTLERASARDTAIRTAVGALCQDFLRDFDIEFLSFVTQVGNVRSKTPKNLWKHKRKIEASKLFCADLASEKKMIQYIQACQKKGESVGGVVQVRVKGLPLGLGNYIQWDQKLDGRIAQALMSIPAIKGVEIGSGFESSHILGSEFQDEIFFDKKQKNNFGYYRKTNRSGGLEGGITSGEELILTAAMKPIPTLPKKNLQTVNLRSHKAEKALTQRTDSCAIAAASIVAKNVVAIEIVRAFLEKFGGDSLKELKKNYQNYLSQKLYDNH